MIEFALIGDLDHEVVIGFSFVPVSLLQPVTVRYTPSVCRCPGYFIPKGKKEGQAPRRLMRLVR